jgi:hypothetical protein
LKTSGNSLDSTGKEAEHASDEVSMLGLFVEFGKIVFINHENASIAHSRISLGQTHGAGGHFLVVIGGKSQSLAREKPSSSLDCEGSEWPILLFQSLAREAFSSNSNSIQAIIRAT